MLNLSLDPFNQPLPVSMCEQVLQYQDTIVVATNKLQTYFLMNTILLTLALCVMAALLLVVYKEEKGVYIELKK